MKSAKSIKEAIVRNYPAIGFDETLGAAIRAMTKNNASALVVKQDGDFIGIVTITDIMHSLAYEQDLHETQINSFMTQCDLISGKCSSNPCAQLDEEQDALSAIKVMHEAGVHHLVVSGSDGKPVGVVSSLEIIRLFGG